MTGIQIEYFAQNCFQFVYWVIKKCRQQIVLSWLILKVDDDDDDDAFKSVDGFRNLIISGSHWIIVFKMWCMAFIYTYVVYKAK